MEKFKSFVSDIVNAYVDKRVTRGAAALAYYLTMTVFPMLICLYSMLGTKYSEAMQAVGIVQNLMADETYEIIKDFLSYVSANNSKAMTVAALLVLLTSASASFRSFEVTVGDMQGEIRFQGFWGFIFSFVFSMVFLAAMYIAIMIMITGTWFIDLLRRIFPFAAINGSWTWVRFFILFGLVLVQICLLYRVTVSRRRRYSTFRGALAATAALVAVCIIFSMFIAASAKYPLVYGSIASVILLIFWLYLCSLMLIMGMVLNIVLRDREEKAGMVRLMEDDDSAQD